MYKYNLWSWYKKVIVKNIKTGKKSETTISKQILRRRNLKVGDCINDEEYITKIIDKENKEVKKVNKIPYFSLKVVKVKRIAHKCPTCGRMYPPINKIMNGKWVENEDGDLKFIEGKNGGNWVNGENLDKIKFPCFCSYMSMSGIRYCELDYIADSEYCKKPFYRIKELKQSKVGWEYINTFCNSDLKKVFEYMKPKILKGKIIIFEEE